MKWITTIKERIEKITQTIKMTIELFKEWMQTTEHKQLLKASAFLGTANAGFDYLFYLAYKLIFASAITLSGTMATIAFGYISATLYIYMREFRDWTIGILEAMDYDEFDELSEDDREWAIAERQSKEYFELKAIGEQHRISDNAIEAYLRFQSLIDDELLSEATEQSQNEIENTLLGMTEDQLKRLDEALLEEAIAIIEDGKTDEELTPKMKALYQQYKAKATSKPTATKEALMA
jgi:hypothetical protein